MLLLEGIMAKIHLLPEDLINKIAAGEVIERPASIVKELLENSLDAAATIITIDIEHSGQDLIRVKDNGEGMDDLDARNSVVRHATSKIQDIDDLFSINTLGFRGEALSSIAAVSQFSLITKQKGKLEGFNLVIEGGIIISSGIVAAEQGTTIEARNLFYNTPARKKFLKTEQVELRHIIDIATRYALNNPKVAFKLYHEGHLLLHSPSVDNLKDNIASIYGSDIAKDLIPIQYDSPDISISGYISKPYHVRNDKSQQSLYVNGRWIKNEDLVTAIYDAYHSLLFVNKHPVFVVSLKIDPRRIDVNVHPHKAIIKIEQKALVGDALATAVKEAFQKNNLIPLVDIEADQQLAFRSALGSAGGKQKYAYEESKQTMLETEEDSSLQTTSLQTEHLMNDESPSESNPPELEERSQSFLKQELRDTFSENRLGSKEDILASQENTSRTGITASYSQQEQQTEPILQKEIYSKLPPLKLLGQIHKTFFVAETVGGVLFIDQHAAHERVLYEEFMEQFLSHSVDVQQLLQPEIIECSPLDTMLIMNNKQEINQLGFKLESFGNNVFQLKTIPSIFGRTQPKEILLEIIATIQDGKSTISQLKEVIITRMACRAAVMAGEELSVYQMQQIINSLAMKKLPFTCPHGRPTIIKTDVVELEKKFKRR